MKNQNHSDKMPHARTARLIIQDMEEEMLVYDLDADKAICLNPAARFIWQKCDGQTCIADASGQISKELNVEATEDFVYLGLKELRESNLLDDSENKFEMEPPVSRRELVARGGVAIGALPIIMSLVAPEATQAQTCVPNGQPCVPASVCCSPTFTCQGSPVGPICVD